MSIDLHRVDAEEEVSNLGWLFSFLLQKSWKNVPRSTKIVQKSIQSVPWFQGRKTDRKRSNLHPHPSVAFGAPFWKENRIRRSKLRFVVVLGGFWAVTLSMDFLKSCLDQLVSLFERLLTHFGFLF